MWHAIICRKNRFVLFIYNVGFQRFLGESRKPVRSIIEIKYGVNSDPPAHQCFSRTWKHQYMERTLIEKEAHLYQIIINIKYKENINFNAFCRYIAY